MSEKVGIESYYRMSPRALWRGLLEQHISFWFVCAYIVCEYVRPQSIYPVLDFLPWAQLSILGGIALWFMDKQRRPVANVQNWLLIAYSVLLLLSIATSYYPGYAKSMLSEFIAWILVYVLISKVVNSKERFFLLLLLYLLVNFKMSQHGFLVWASRGFAFDGWGVTGAPGWFQNSGEFGIQLTIYLPLAIAFIFALRGYWNRWLLGAFALMPITAFGSVVATSSRGAQLAVAVTAGWFVLRSKYRVKGLLIAAALCTIMWFLIPEEQMARIQSAGEDNTSTQRLIYWTRGWQLMLEHPVTGIGYMNWLPYYMQRWPGELAELPHNIFVQAGTELGFPGLIVFVLMVIFVFVNNRRARLLAQRSGDRVIEILTVGMDGALVGFLISGSFVSVLYYPYFWVHMAMSVALHSIAKEQARAPLPAVVPESTAAPAPVSSLSGRAARLARLGKVDTRRVRSERR